MHCETILVVENHDDARDAIELALKEEGYRVYAVRDAREAMAALKRIPERTLVLLDLMSPGATEFRSTHRPIPAVSYIRKPIRLERLLETVHQYCDAREDDASLPEAADAARARSAAEIRLQARAQVSKS